MLSLSLAGSGACVAFFWAEWHEPSKRGGQMEAVMAHLAQAHGPRAVTFLRVEAEALPELSHKLSIAVVPTFLFLLGGRGEGITTTETERKRHGRATTNHHQTRYATLRSFGGRQAQDL
jgi:hypothetical protein